VTAEVLGNLGQLAQQFDTHGQELAKAAEQIEMSNKRTEASLGERRSQLDQLVSAMDVRTDDLEQRLKRFSSLLDETLEAAAVRARDVARVVSETSAEGARAVTDQFDRVRNQAEEVVRVVTETSSEGARTLSEQYERLREHAEAERRDAAETMRNIYERSTGETHALFREATERFADTLRGMKQMAAEMQRELEETRNELRRGVFELPQETAESAAQMRRVIVDQIEALAELNRIVARHGRSLDAVEPVRQRTREEPTLAIAGGRGETVARGADLPSRTELPSRPELPTRTPLRSEPSHFAPTSRRASGETASVTPLPSTPQGTGWLSDLLSRASRDEEPVRDFPRESRETTRARDTERSRDIGRGNDERTPRHSIESLDSLSVDIARMIDHDAAADLWDRYKRGERNVFTRRLYTLQGQQAFDEIRKKYRGDREFKQTVDRYIGEFERLLDEVSRDDRSQVMARTYLTSETGKVYTMLAHAAGRFDN
jgi:F0F1-type ATP synthase membrane subunit b/b'